MTTNDDLNAFLEKIFNTIQQQRNGADDGSDLTKEAIREAMDEIDQKSQVEKDKLKSELDSLKKELKEAIKNKDAAKEKELRYKTSAKEKQIRDFDSATAKTKLNYRTEKRVQAKGNVYRTVTNGRSDNVSRTGQSMSKFGNSIKNITGGKGAFGKFGGALAKTGGLLTKFAGPIGIAITVINGLVEGFKAYNKIQERAAELEKEKIDLENQRMQAQNAITLKKMQLDNDVLSQTNGYNQEILGMRYEMAQAVAEFQASMSNQATQIGADSYVAANKMAIQAPFDIKGAMYAAGNAAIDLASQARMFEIEEQYGGQEVSNKLAGIQANMDKTTGLYQTELNTSVSKAKNEIDTDTRRMETDYANAMMDYDIHAKQNIIDNTKTIGEATSSIIPFASSVTNYGTDIAQSKLDLEKAENEVIKGQKETLFIQNKQLNDVANMDLDRHNLEKKNEMEMQYIKETGELKFNDIRIGYEKKNAEIQAKAAAEISKEYMGLAQKVNDEFLSMENNAYIMGRQMGLGGEQLRRYTEEMGKSQVALSLFGKNLEWAQQQQTAYQESTGRNIQYSNDDRLTSAGFGTLIGDDIVNQLNAGMEIFNTSVSDSNTMIYEMYRNTSKIGLNGKKYTKDLANNLKLAEKYNFKNGVKSLMEMSKWSQNMRFNMGSLDGMLDKVQEGGLEGVVKQAAELQVLGGDFAMGADPMAMAYESFMDPEGFAKRLNGMVANQGTFNSKTGEVDFGIASQMRMRAMAKATGQDYKDVLAQAKQIGKIKRISQSLNPNANLDEDQQALIANKATYDKERNEFYVNDNDGNRMYVSDINSSNIGNIQPELSQEELGKTQLEATQKMVSEIAGMRSTQEVMKSAEQEMKSILQENLWPTLRDNNQQMIETLQNNFNIKLPQYIAETSKAITTMNNAVTEFSKMFNNGDGAIDSQVKEINTKVADISTTLRNIEAKGNMYAGFTNISVDTSNASNITSASAVPVHDGFISQNGNIAKIDNQDQVLAAKSGGPIDKMLNNVSPRPMPYNSSVKESPYYSGQIDKGSDKVEIAPIQISINGNIQLNGGSGSIDITQHLTNDPNFIRSLSQIISLEVEKKVQGGRVVDPVNRSLSY